MPTYVSGNGAEQQLFLISTQGGRGWSPSGQSDHGQEGWAGVLCATCAPFPNPFLKPKSEASWLPWLAYSSPSVFPLAAGSDWRQLVGMGVALVRHGLGMGMGASTNPYCVSGTRLCGFICRVCAATKGQWRMENQRERVFDSRSIEIA